MKARVFKTESQIRKIVQDEAKRQTTSIYEAAMQDSVYQALATMMYVLNRDFGFGGERLKKLKNLTEDEFMVMRTGICGKHYDANNCVKYLKEKYGIDFAESQYDENYRKVRK